MTQMTSAEGSVRGQRFATMTEAYPALRDYILANGQRVAPRGEGTIEILGASFQIDDAVNGGVPIGTGRKVGVKMQAIDGTGNLSGFAYPDVARQVAPIMGRFMDVLEVGDSHVTDGVYVRANALAGELFQQGAYGPRIGDQLTEVEKQLRHDPHTRQAVVSLWTEEDRDPFWKDRPCTTEFQLMIRDGKLDIFVFMRANDLWTGTCYDVFQFGQIQAAMAHILNIPVGAYHHYATSLHIYERDIEKFEAVQYTHVENERESAGPDWSALAHGEYTSWPALRAFFKDILDAVRHDEPPVASNPVEHWYETVLRTGRAPDGLA